MQPGAIDWLLLIGLYMRLFRATCWHTDVIVVLTTQSRCPVSKQSITNM